MNLQDKYIPDSSKNVISKRINNYFDNGSIYVPNKFIVLLYGEYVTKAIDSMIKDIDNQNQNDLKRINDINFTNWLKNFYFNGGNDPYFGCIDLGWACKDVSIPTSNSEFEEDFVLDTIKQIRYPLIKSPVKIQNVSMTIVEDRHLMFYQFFNSLINQFFNPKVLKANSSFHKLNIAVVALTQTDQLPDEDNVVQTEQVKSTLLEKIFSDNSGNTPTPRKNKDVYAIPGNVFEFTSASLDKLENINLSNASKAPLEYRVNFKVPNSFQSSFNNELSGSLDKTSDSVLLDPPAKKASNSNLNIDDISYNRSAFEQSIPSLNTKYPAN